MTTTEPSEKEVIFRIANDESFYHVYVSAGSIGGNKIIRNMTITHEDENGTIGILPRRAISIRTVKGGAVPRKKREFTDEQRAAVSERFKKYHANKRVNSDN